MPTKLICHTPDCVSCGADGTCKLDGEIRVDQKRCQSYTPHSIPFMEKPLALSELPKEEWVCHILEESGATFVSLEDFYEPYGKALRRDLIWRIPYGCLDFSGCVLCLVQEGILCLPYDAVDSQEYELFKMDSERLLTKESLLELLQEFNEQTASLATVLMEMGKLVLAIHLGACNPVTARGRRSHKIGGLFIFRLKAAPPLPCLSTTG